MWYQHSAAITELINVDQGWKVVMHLHSVFEVLEERMFGSTFRLLVSIACILHMPGHSCIKILGAIKPCKKVFI